MTTIRSMLHHWTVGGLLALLVAGAGPDAHAGPPLPPATGQVLAAMPATGRAVEIAQHAFRPATVTVPVGTAVTWINHDDDVHTVTSRGDVFTSKGLDTDDTFTYTFTRPGTYGYFCKLHPLMTGTVVVR
jgi:plastocyanin